MSKDFRDCRWEVVISKSCPSLKSEDEGQRGRDEKHVVEMLVKDWPCADGFNQPAVDGIEKAG